MQNIHPISGWALNYIVALDAHRPGVAGAYFRASDERRHVAAAMLATHPLPTSAPEARQLADFAMEAGHREILVAAFGRVPRGLRGALARSGPQPQSRSYYRTLYEMLSSTKSRRAASIIGQLDSLDLTRLRVIDCLPYEICSANLVGVIGNPRMAADVAKLFDLLSENGIDRKALAEALRKVSSASQLPPLWHRWSQKLTFPLHPVPATDDFIPIRTGAELRRLALRYRNCSMRYISNVMEGESAFAEFKWSAQRAVIHLIRHDGKWMLEGVFGTDNDLVEPELRSAAVGFLEEHGIQTALKSQDRQDEWGVLRRLSSTHPFGF